LGLHPENQFDKIIEHDITQTIYNTDSAKALSECAVKLNKKAKVHLKIDTGMSRIGFCPEICFTPEFKELFSLPGLEIEGIFTHFARADEKDRSCTNEQFRLFIKVISSIEEDGYSIPIKHAANSAGIMEYPETHLDMVRPGIILYGLYPSDEVSKQLIHLKPVMSLKTRVSNVKVLPKGKAISYGGTVCCSKREHHCHLARRLRRWLFKAFVV